MLVESALLHAAKGTPAALVTDRCMGQGIFFLYIKCTIYSACHGIVCSIGTKSGKFLVSFFPDSVPFLLHVNPGRAWRKGYLNSVQK